MVLLCGLAYMRHSAAGADRQQGDHVMTARKLIYAATMAIGLVSAPSQAQAADPADQPKWFVQAGVSLLSLRDKNELRFAGTVVPDANINTKTHFTPTVTIGRFVAPHIAIAGTVGIPPHINVDGRDTLAPFGRLAETTYGPTAVLLQYHFNPAGKVQPYVGAGASYMIIFSTKDGSFRDVTIEDDLAPALGAGAIVMVGPKLGIFADVKKAFLRTTARGTFNGTPLESDVGLDPWVVTTGATIRF